MTPARLGLRYRDTHTNTTGIAVARTAYVDGSARVCIAYQLADGTPNEAWFEELRLTPQPADAPPPAVPIS